MIYVLSMPFNKAYWRQGFNSSKFWILNYYPNYPTHRLYFGEVETPYATANGEESPQHYIPCYFFLFNFVLITFQLYCSERLTNNFSIHEIIYESIDISAHVCEFNLSIKKFIHLWKFIYVNGACFAQQIVRCYDQ